MLIFAYNADIEHNIHFLLLFKMSISENLFCVHNSNFQQVIISFGVLKQQIINDVKQF